MGNQDFTTTISVDRSPEEVFAAINHVRGWWSGEIEGHTDKLGAEFTYRYKDVHRSNQKVTEFISGKRVVWHVLDSDLNFVNKRSEWSGKDIVFDISEKAGKTELCFTHVGLVPRYECYGSCSNAWGTLINGNLRKLITTGKSPARPVRLGNMRCSCREAVVPGPRLDRILITGRRLLFPLPGR